MACVHAVVVTHNRRELLLACLEVYLDGANHVVEKLTCYRGIPPVYAAIQDAVEKILQLCPDAGEFYPRPSSAATLAPF